MSLRDEAQSAKLAHHGGASGLGFQGGRPRIAVAIDNVARVCVGPATGVVDQARGVQSLETLRQSRRVILPPAFVEEDPKDDGWMVVEILDHVKQFGLKFPLSFRGGVVA